MARKLSYWLSLLIAIDQLANALLWGAPDETLSSRAYRHYWARKTSSNGKYRWVVIFHIVNAIFFDREHCKKSYIAECNRAHYPADWETYKQD